MNTEQRGEKIYLLADNAASLTLFRAMCDYVEKKTTHNDATKQFNIATDGSHTDEKGIYANVFMTVNGVELPFSEIITLMINSYDRQVAVTAREQVAAWTDNAEHKLQQAVRIFNAELGISDKLFEKYKDRGMPLAKDDY